MDNSRITRPIEEWLVAYLSRRLGVDAQSIDVHQPFVRYGLASIEGITLVQKLGDWLGRTLPATLAWEYPTIEALARHVADVPTVSDADPVAQPSPQSPQQSESIAIVGIGCRFPGAEDLQAFWQLLSSGGNGITEIPIDRWDANAFYDPDISKPARMVSRWGGFIPALDQFDASFFGISPREAAQLDPRQRLMLEVAWQALEDAGIPPLSLAGSRTGVFTATLSANYGSLLFDRNLNVVDAYAGTGNGNSVIANRLSYFLDLRGPSLSLDTACSGSLVAIHLACQSLLSGEATLALSGGVNVILKPDDSIIFSKTGALSPDGQCKVFDRRANGIVRSEGAGIVVLKPLSRALADKDRIYAVIRGSAVNQNGAGNGILAPSGQSQEAMLKEAYRKAGISPGAVKYIEAHGTGTSLGDPIEVKALGAVLSADRPPGSRCALGSVKTNIGHTEAAAGVAGLIKVALALKHRLIPPNLHFEEPNPLIPFDELPIFVQQTLGPWPSDSEPLIAGVSSFGFAGTNAHIVLEEAPQQVPVPPVPHGPAEVRPYLLPISARSPQARLAMAREYLEALTGAGDTPSISDVCYTAAVRRSHLEHRLALVAHSKEELTEHLAAFLRDEARPGMSHASKRLDRRPRLVMVFSGQGSHWFGMGARLMEQEPVFRIALEQCDRLMREHVEWSLLEQIAAPAEQSRLNETDVAQPAIFAIQVGLAALWRSWGITPDVIIGQSLGEIAAAHVAGALSLEDAVSVVFHRSRLMKRVAGQGKTAVVGLPLEHAELALTGFEDLLSVAGSNSPTSSIVSGDPDALERVLASLTRRNIFCRVLKGVDVAFHSPQMEPLRDELVQALQGIQPKPAAVPVFSTVTVSMATGTEFDAAYWGRNLREPFHFTRALTQLLESDYDTFLEVSPHPVLSPAILENISHAGKKGTVLPSLHREKGEKETMLGSLGALYAAGHSVSWPSLYKEGELISLPSYPWQRERYWFDQLLDGQEGFGFSPQSSGNGAGRESADTHPLLGRHLQLASPPGQHVWEPYLAASSPSYLADHQVRGAVVLPGAAYLEMGMAAATEAFGLDVYVLEDIAFKQALFLSSAAPRKVEIVLSPMGADASFQVFSLPMGVPGQGEAWTLHAAGKVRRASDSPITPPQQEPLQAIRLRCREEVSGAAHYDAMSARGLQYGPAFQAVEVAWRQDGEALGRLQLPADLEREAPRYAIHPALLDASFQVVALTSPLTGAGAGETRLPVGLDSVYIYGQPSGQVWCHVRLRPDAGTDADVLVADVSLLDEAGQTLAEMRGLRLQRIESAQQTLPDSIDDWLYRLEWLAKDAPGEQHAQLPRDYMPGPLHIRERIEGLMAPLSAQ
ncbi:MAG TPA: beta-ketoacyl synthase N-terminal-like domain-containing protein, partial [Chloroflexia bacterium]|nr:beta-ketoacyl synthase N-terminal-like domain-containing protein [Chloroflexia bacterium]